jgi:NAD(P)-dependent dehydrogenase (short-subunit alcohol dehydrogenase family)
MTEPYPFPTSADEFTDKRVLVTGGTRGIGAAVVRRFQLAGARVAATARSASAHSMDGVLFIPADIGTAAGREHRQPADRRLGRTRHPQNALANARMTASSGSPCVHPVARRLPFKFTF